MFFQSPIIFGLKKMNPFVTNRCLGGCSLNQPFSGTTKGCTEIFSREISGFRHRVMMPTAVPRARASHVLVGLEFRAKPSHGGGVERSALEKSEVRMERFPITVQHGSSQLLCIYCIHMSCILS